MSERWLTPAERWAGERIWFGRVVKWGRLHRSAVRGFYAERTPLIGGKYLTLELGVIGFYVCWFWAA